MIALVVAIAACGSDSTNSPDNTVSGRWSYSATDLHGIVSFSCSILDATMSLTQSGTTLTGSVSGGTLSCLGSGGFTNEALSGGVITNGVINGSTVQLEFGTQHVQNVGTVSGNSMSGRVALSGVLGTTVQMTGNFSAVRQ
jgi:hypothetical protein